MPDLGHPVYIMAKLVDINKRFRARPMEFHLEVTLRLAVAEQTAPKFIIIAAGSLQFLRKPSSFFSLKNNMANGSGVDWAAPVPAV